MQILIVEDDVSKAEQLSAAVAVSAPDATLTVRRSYQSAVKEVTQRRYDLLVLDMSMPTYDINGPGQGGTIRGFAGWDVMRELKRRHIHVHTLVVTQFETFADGGERITLEQLGEELQNEFGKQYLGIVYFSALETKWKDELGKVVQERGRA